MKTTHTIEQNRGKPLARGSLFALHLPPRDSSLTDVVNNVLGTFIGAGLFLAARGILYR